MRQFLIGIVLLCAGITLASIGIRPWIDYDFTIGWYGFLIILDVISQEFQNASLFSPIRPYLSLAFASSFFWWFYEWINLHVQNWAYPIEKLYGRMEFGLIATINFTTVIPLLILSTNIISGVFFKHHYHFIKKPLSKIFAIFSILLGLLSIALCILIPVNFCFLLWFILLLIFDPINALQGRRSLFVQVRHGNFKPLLILLLASILAGLCWETMNHFMPKWTYPIEPWFWKLPAPITTKYFAMPLGGFLGYIPFIFSAFSFMTFLDLPIPWLAEKRNQK